MVNPNTRLRGFRPGFLHLSDSLLHVEVLSEIGIPQPRGPRSDPKNSWRGPSSSAHRPKKTAQRMTQIPHQRTAPF